VTIPSWPCSFSGLDPEQIGYYWFDHPEKGLFNSSVWKNESIFNQIQSKIFVLNVPGTYPAWKVNGEMITGLLSPSISCYPPELKFFIENNWIIDGKNPQEIFKAFEIKKKLFLRKMEEDFNLLVFVIRIPDGLSHTTHLSYEKVMNYINLGYQKIDSFLGEVINAKNFDNIFIFSDHGLKHYEHEFNLRRWLEKKRLLFINQSEASKIYSIVAKIFDKIRPFIKIDYEKYHILKKIILKNVIKEPRIILDKKNKTKVLHFYGNVGGLYLKSEEKFKLPKIKRELELDKRVKEIISSDVEGFPDLFIILDEKYIFNHNSSFFVIRGRHSFNHSQYGIFMAFGKNIIKEKLDLIDYKDIAPTILKLFGLKKQNYMKGKILNIIRNN
jgi:predicted AlkP superfamily phosphohydrolase/phosphomutase